MKRAFRILLTLAMIPLSINIGFRVFRSEWIQELARRLEPGDTFRIALYLFMAYYASIVLHELGHFVLGLATGYRFLSFRILSLSVEKQRNGKLRWKRRPVSGTLGQCLMVPNDTKNPSIFWYNFGGVLFNLVQIGFSWVGFTRSVTIVGELWWFAMIMMGLLFFVFNWFPFRHSNNDGNNYREIKRNPLSLEAFVHTLRISRDIADDARLSDIELELEYNRLSYDKPIQSWVKSLHVMKALYEVRLADYLAMTDEAETHFEHRRDPRANGLKMIFYLSRLMRIGASAIQTKDTLTIKLLKTLKRDPLIQMIAYYEALLTNHPKKEWHHARFLTACLKAPYQGEAKDIRNLARVLESAVSNGISLMNESPNAFEMSV